MITSETAKQHSKTLQSEHTGQVRTPEKLCRSQMRDLSSSFVGCSLYSETSGLGQEIGTIKRNSIQKKGWIAGIHTTNNS